MANDDPRASLAPSIIAAILAAAGASGVSVYFSPGSRVANDPMARPDPYTGSMHQQYAETVDARFDAVYRALQDHDRRMNEIREQHKEMETRQASYYQAVLAAMERIHSALLQQMKHP